MGVSDRRHSRLPTLSPSARCHIHVWFGSLTGFLSCGHISDGPHRFLSALTGGRQEHIVGRSQRRKHTPVAFRLLNHGESMPTSPIQHRNSNQWRSLFRVALIETDLRLVEKRISDAEEAITTRIVEIFRHTSAEAQVERELLNDAIYILRARRSAVENKTAA